MGRRQGLDVTVGKLSALSQHAQDLAGPGLARVQQRAMGTLKRRAKAEAARLLSERVLALSPRAISPFISVSVRDTTLTIYGARKRLPLSMFSPVAGPRGVSATIWRDQGPKLFEHTFIRRGTREVWQRVPFTGQKGQRVAPSGLVQRLMIVQRKGPEFSRAVRERKHGDIHTPMVGFAQNVVALEIRRLLKVENGQ